MAAHENAVACILFLHYTQPRAIHVLNKMEDNMLTKNSDTLKIEVRRHIAADAVLAGTYWDNEIDNDIGGAGCFIGCLAHSSDIQPLVDKYGFDPKFTRLCEGVFEGLSSNDADKGRKFFSDIGEYMKDGVDTEMVVWAVLRKALERLPKHDCITTVIDLLKRIEAGEGRGSLRAQLRAAAAAAAAADAAYAAAAAAADYAAYAAAYAADAADVADVAAAAAAAYAAAAAAAYATERKQQAADIINAIRGK